MAKRKFDPAKLPAEVFVKWEPDDEKPFLLASEDVNSEEDGTVVGAYRLISVQRVRVSRILELEAV